MDQFLLFGDSITQHAYPQNGFAALLSNAYIRRLDVIDRGLSGYNTQQALTVLPRIVPKPEDARIRLMTVFFGANDARLPNTPSDPQQHVPLDEFAKNLRAILTHPMVQAHEDVRIIVVTTPPVDERKLLEGGLAKYPEQGAIPRRTAAVTATYAQAVRGVAKELHLPVVDIWKVMIELAGGTIGDAEVVGSENLPSNEVLRSFLLDGLHFSPEGYKVLYDELMKVIETTWPDQRPEALPFVLPAWDDKLWQS